MASSSTEDTSDMNFFDYVASIEIPLNLIESSTDNFARKNLITRGSYAHVYKGQLMQSGELIDIVVRKCLQPNVNIVVNDLTMYKDLRHKNIISLFKVDDTTDQALTIHKYQAHESLDKHLGGSTLTWMQRLKICVGVAHALQYLHFGLKEDYSVIHGNIKSSKILLDLNWEPKLHDFRCAVKVKRHTLYVTSKYNGTLQYMDPSFESTGGLTHKSDVFSFGVVLFEVLFGRKASMPVSSIVAPLREVLFRRKTSIPEKDIWYFAELARLHYEENRLDDMIDPDLRKQMDNQSLNIYSEVAYCCLKEHQTDRPNMNHIVKKLERALELHQSLVQSPEAEGASFGHFKGGNMDHLKVPLSEIISATKNFSETHYIGCGGYGEVYKGILDRFDTINSSGTKGKNDGESPNVAIKRIPSIRTGREGFLAEIELLSKCKHQNIVSLLGFCHEGPNMVLIYEYASKGSLDDYLTDSDNMTNLTWVRRLQICLDIAQGLDYLHESMPDKPTIIHRDMKSANILLDDKLVAKIADFGLSKLCHESQQDKTLITRGAGTWVYMDPEYIETGKLKKQTDTYSFGVVLFEIMSGKLAYDNDFREGLGAAARQRYKDGTLKELVDPNLKKADENIFLVDGGVNEDSLEKFLEIACQCVSEFQSQRPTMKFVIKELEEALSLQKNSKDRLHISLKQIQAATENFSDYKCIGEGRYWKQYKGELTHANKRTPIVAKRWDSKFPQSQHQFSTELQIFKKSKQENIISLVGYCNEMGEKIVVYESASNGSLDKHLGDASLTWMRRLKMCIDVARGLEYLHTSVSMIHRDIKSASILLDGDWRAKISNLELSTQLSDLKPIEHVTDDNAYGSRSYVSPEDKEQGYLTRESDIYSLGVVLKQVLLGRLTVPTDRYNHNVSHVVWNGQELIDYRVLEGIKEQIDPKSLATFKYVAGLCLAYREYRPRATEVIKELEKALKFQEDYEVWEPKLPIDYKNIIEMSQTPNEYSTKMKKDLYSMFQQGILLQDGKVWFSLGHNGERNEMISARKFSYKIRRSHKWQFVEESRFQKAAKMFDISKLGIKIKITTQLLSPGVNYGAHLIFKFCDKRKFSREPMYVNLNYKMGGDSIHAYFATWRDDNWMMIELGRFLSQKKDTHFEVLLESFARYYCGSSPIYVEGIEFRVIDNVKHEKIEKKEDVQHLLKSKSSKDQLLSSNEVNGKKHLMLSAKDILYDSSNVKCFHLKPSAELRFEEAIEILPQQVFRISCKVKSHLLSCDTDYVCCLVFKLSEKCRGLHCLVKVRNLLHRNNKQAEILYFRFPSPWNLQDNYQVPETRGDGWMEVIVGKFNSTSDLRNDHIPINLKLITYEGTMSGLIVYGLEIKPM